MAANLSENYEKVALGAALLLALGFGTTVYLKADKIDQDFPAPPTAHNPVPDNPRESQVENVHQSLGQPHEWKPPRAGGRLVKTFTGLPIFVKKGQSGVVDLGDDSYPAVHPPIPNGWWIEHRLDPGYADSPQRDADEDGFLNLEEFEAKTDPNDATDHPPLINKLELAKMEVVPYKLTYSSHTATGPIQPDDSFQFKVLTLGGKRNSSEYLKPGAPDGASIFFKTRDPAKLRFELLSVKHERKLNPRNNIEEDVFTATVADKRPNKEGTTYQIEKGTNQAIMIRDYTATLYLNAIDQSGNEFQIEESGSFALPYDPNAPEKPFVFKGVNEARDKAVIEWQEDGQTRQKLLPIPEK